MLASEPERDVTPPDIVLDVAAGRSTRAVWENDIGGLTFEIGREPDRVFVKWYPSNERWRLDAEAVRLLWAVQFTAVPELVDAGADATGAWLVTRALQGDSAVSTHWKQEPRTAVQAIGAGLRALHDALPVTSCPFSWSANARVDDARKRAGDERLDPRQWHEIHRHLTIDDALRAVAEPPPTDRLVVCHGDACAPNTLLSADGHCSGHVDLDSLGVADAWADLAVATWSAEWNYGAGWEPTLLDGYRIDPDPERSSYYRLLWDLGP